MKIIKIRHPYNPADIPTEEVVLVLGFFDGVHRGHQKVIKTGKAVADEKGLKLAVMTFTNHPSIVFHKVGASEMQYLTTLPQKEALMEWLGVDYLYEVEFTSTFAHLSPQTFVDQYIVGLHAQVAVSGFDYTYGPREIADVAHLPEYAKGRFEIVTVEKESDGGAKISSSRIRELLAEGNMEEANHLLGYPYTISGLVIHGEARGRLLGYPTANVNFSRYARLPMEGVYVCQLQVGDTWYEAMGSIGHNDTFGEGRQLTMEINILDFHEEIYGETVNVRWLHLIRNQVKFNSAEELIDRLKQDEEETRAYFEQNT